MGLARCYTRRGKRSRTMSRGLIALGIVSVLGSAMISGHASAQCQNNCDVANPTVEISPSRAGRPQAAGSDFADATMWPPNHKFRSVLIGVVDPDGIGCDVAITDVCQDERVNKAGSGNTAPDAKRCSNVGDASFVRLRSERKGAGDGRYYHVFFTATDIGCPAALPALGEAVVLVRHDQGKKKTSVDGGPLFASCGSGTEECGLAPCVCAEEP